MQLVEDDTKACPYCGEEVVVVGTFKCKYCEAELAENYECSTCGKTFQRANQLRFHPQRAHEIFIRPPESVLTNMQTKHGVVPRPSGESVRNPVAPKIYKGRMGSREPISAVGDQSSGGLACPKCGGAQFTAKRSNKGKLFGFMIVGVGGLIAPKSQVKCVTCGTMFKRG